MSILINAYSTLVSPPKPQFEYERMSRRDRSDPELVEHLSGFVNYIMNSSGNEMSALVYHVICHIHRVQNQFSITIAESDFEEFSQWAWEANALCFLPDGTVRDPSGSILVDSENDSDPDAVVPYPEDAMLRKEKTLKQLEGLGIRTLTSLPPVISEQEVVLREATDVARRMLALFLVSVRGESLGSDEPLALDDLRENSPTGFEALSPKELEFLENDEPEENDAIQFTWRYEALHVLEWALGLISELPFPSGICDVQLVAQLAIDNDSEEFFQTCQLRPVGEILDALDQTYRLHWALRNSGTNSDHSPDTIDPGVVMERHYALNWLVRFGDNDWDEIETPT